ncbi:peptide/nickel transport system permease protein [Ruminococcus sp. YE71]|uniref:ABC transporter permease n=1 Tax=unclassified Ruminococcus TaxID=2608920 RepID=UPI00088C61A3|nr:MULTISPECIES: ABC transporter permease [unclassified Ruminococcus]SDA21788.1 peptide/nickel transport system permease protein [Ruminococcus sp. YE78]SFW36878.1 peptide/nickel transport system permease protein [Ruminococcus sp. YE71]
MHDIIKKNRKLFTPVFVISAVILAVIVAASAAAPLLAPYEPEQLDLTQKLSGVSSSHLLGTDKVGRDILSRVLFGGRTTLLSALAVVLISVVTGIPAGLFMGYYGGKADTVINNIWSIILACPSILLAFVLMSIIGKGITAGIIALGVIYIPMISRLTRSLTIIEKNKTYVEASRVLGYSSARILFLQILPNCVSTIIAELTLDLAYAILDLAGLSFLGLGVQPPQADWGYILSDGQQFIMTHTVQALIPGILIVAAVLALNLLSGEIMAYIDPNVKNIRPLRRGKDLRHGFHRHHFTPVFKKAVTSHE